MARTKSSGRKPKSRVTWVQLANVRPLVTIGPEHRVWSSTADFDVEPFRDALVRLLPPSVESGQALVQAVKARLNGVAAGVKDQSRSDSAAAVTRKSVDAMSDGDALTFQELRVRDVIFGLVENSNSQDVERLRDVVERCLSEANL